jgi:hypothetical protein
LADSGWFDDLRARLENAYLSGADPRAQSGFHGDEQAWERARRPILEAIDRDGTLLDIGCANGLLMDSLWRWAAERGIQLEPFGLDLSPALAALARERLPRWGDRIFDGNALEWRPVRRFDFVRTELVYVPRRTRRAYAERLLAEFLTDAGRLIVCSYGSARRADPAEHVGEMLRTWDLEVAGRAEATNEEGFPLVRVAWVDGPAR